MDLFEVRAFRTPLDNIAGQSEGDTVIDIVFRSRLSNISQKSQKG